MAVLSTAETRKAVERHFGDLGSVVVDFMVEVISQESGRDPAQVGDNFASGHQSSSSPARYDYGLAQINSQHGYDPKRLVDDIDYNLAAARTIYDKQGPSAWATAPAALAAVQARGGGSSVASEAARRIALDYVRANYDNLPSAQVDEVVAAIQGALDSGVSEAAVRTLFTDKVQYQSFIRSLGTAGSQSSSEAEQLATLESQLGLGGDSTGTAADGTTAGNAFATMREALTGAMEALTGRFADGSLFAGVPAAEIPLVLAEQTQALTGMLDVISQINTLENQGGFLGADGSFITLNDLEHADPLVQAQARAEFFKFGESVFGSGNAYLKQLGLEEFIVDPADRETWVDPSEIRDRAQSKFNNDLAELQSKIDIESLSVDDAVKRIDRTLSGLQESRTRADYVTKTLMDAAKWGSPSGKTSFSAADLGAGVGALARQAGIGGNAPLVNYTGIQDINPEGILAKYDESILGGQTFLPQIPNRTIDFSTIPSPPNLSEVPLVPFQVTGAAQPRDGYGGAVPNVVGAPQATQGVATGGNPQPTNEQRQILRGSGGGALAGAPPIVTRIGGLADSAEGPL